MKVIQEVTDWDAPNHIYFIERSRCVGYIPVGKEEPVWFSKPLNFSQSKRKFKKVTDKKILKKSENPVRSV